LHIFVGVGLQASVLGASGFSGGEVLRILAGHPAIAVELAAARSRSGESLAEVHPHLAGTAPSELCSIEEAIAAEVDVCFACLPPGHLKAAPEPRARVVVDLSSDFRDDRSGRWVPGLSELARSALVSATRIANPGCYPTAALLSLVPFARAGVIEGPVLIDAISGISGAGRASQDGLGFAVASASVSAYGSVEHRHVPEIERGLAAWAGLSARVSFTPHLAPFARGLLTTARAPLTTDLTDAEALELLRAAYGGESFVRVLPGWPATKPVCGTNHAHVSARVDGRNRLLICSAAIDNLGKGAAGQAVQNANLALGLEETVGLTAWGVWP
jgi:N-acetyl-gamma-glutamyl-phosphate reductase